MIENFKEITGYDLQSFFEDFNNFVNTKYNSIVAYYNGNGEIDRGAFIELNKLIKESDFIENLFSVNCANLSYNVGWWNILSTFEDVQDRLLTIKNSPKWFRSYYINDFDRNTNMSYITKENETIEYTARSLEYGSPEDDWIDLAIKNDVSEEDYDEEGGTLLKVTFSNNRSINITSVVDVMVGLNVLGKDISREIVFENDDIKILTPKNTITQSTKIKFEIRKGTIPEFPEIGIPIVEGSNYNFLRYPIIFRELSQLFRLDDTFKSIEITDIRRDQDAIFMDVKIKSKLKEIEQLQSLLI